MDSKTSLKYQKDNISGNGKVLQNFESLRGSSNCFKKKCHEEDGYNRDKFEDESYGNRKSKPSKNSRTRKYDDWNKSQAV